MSKICLSSQARICNACPVKSQCTDSRSGRHLRRSFFQEYLDRVKDYHETEAYRKAMRKRQVWVEPLFGEGKQWHRLRQFVLRGLEKVNIQGLMIAAGQNIKRLLTRTAWKLQPIRRVDPHWHRLARLTRSASRDAFFLEPVLRCFSTGWFIVRHAVQA